MRTASRWSLAMIGAGVPAGASSPNQAVASKPGKPASTMVGRSGDDGARVSEGTASGRTLPSRERQRRDGTGEHHGQATAEQVRHHRCVAAVGDMLDVKAGHGLVQLAGEMLGGADAGGAKGELAKKWSQGHLQPGKGKGDSDGLSPEVQARAGH